MNETSGFPEDPDKFTPRQITDILTGRIRKLEGVAPTLASGERDKAIAARKKEAGFLRRILKAFGTVDSSSE
jgi:hypothetical protein